MKTITIYKTEWWRVKERVIEWDIKYFDGYVKITDKNWIEQVVKNFNNIIVS